MKRQKINALLSCAAVLAAIVTATPAFVGPPLLCHPFEIGTARSLPWDGNWSQGKADYKIAGCLRARTRLKRPDALMPWRSSTRHMWRKRFGRSRACRAPTSWFGPRARVPRSATLTAIR